MKPVIRLGMRIIRHKMQPENSRKGAKRQKEKKDC